MRRLAFFLMTMFISTTVFGGWFYDLPYYKNIFQAIDHNDAETIDYFLENGVDIEVINKCEEFPSFYNKETPLLYAVNHLCSEEIILTLLNHGANVEAKNKYGHTPLLNVCTIKSNRNQHEHIIPALLENGADIEAKDSRGNTPLILATRNGLIKVMHILIEYGADIEVKNNSGNTALLESIVSHENSSVEILLSAGADTGNATEKGFTPLMLASMHGNIEIVKILLNASANINDQLVEDLYLVEEESKSPFSYSFYPSNKKTYCIPAGSTALSFAKKFGGSGVKKLLLEDGARENPEIKNDLEELNQELNYL